MNKERLCMGAFLVSTFFACGGPEADAKELCGCVEKALADGQPFEEIEKACEPLSEKFEAKYKDNEKEKKKFDEAGEECLKPMKQKLQKSMKEVINPDLAKLRIKEVTTGLDIHKMKKNKYPETLEQIKKFLHNEKVPKDPWGNDFYYTTNSSCGTGYELISYGQDGQKGGGDDISSCDKE